MIKKLFCFIVPAAMAACLFAEDRAGKEPNDILNRTLERVRLDGGLKPVLEEFSRIGGVKLEVDWPALAQAGVKEQAKVGVKIDKATAAQTLDVILSAACPPDVRLAWYVDDQVIRVSTQDRVINRKSRPASAAVAPVRKGAFPQSAPAATTAPASEISFNDTPLSGVIDYFRKAAGVNFVVNWRSLADVNVEPDTPVTLKVSGVSLARAMDLVMDQLSANRSLLERVYWVVDEGVVTVATGNALNATVKTRVYDASDLLMEIPGIDRSSAGQAGMGGGAGWVVDTSTGKSNAGPGNVGTASEEKLIGAIKDSIGPEMWQPLGKGAIRVTSGKLIISQTLLGFKLLERSSGNK